MLRLLADENLDGNILRGVLRRVQGVDVVRVQDVGLSGAEDPAVLAWAAKQGRVLVTHDVETVTGFAFERVDAGLAMPGVIEIVATAPIGKAVEDLALLIECLGDGELKDRVIYLPMEWAESPPMIHDPQHTLTALEVLPPLGLRLSFADGATLSVDLAPTIRTHRALAALADPALFATARLDSRGGYVVWIEDDLEIAADNLRNLAMEQAGGIGNERLANWMAEHGLTQERAANAIGISRRMLNYYLAGSRPIPKTVWLACLWWAAERKDRLAAA